MIGLLLVTALGIVLSTSSVQEKRRHITNDELKANFSKYYYQNLQEKLLEITSSTNNCTFGREADPNTLITDFQIRIVPPPAAVTKLWGSEGREIHSVPKIYSRTSENLCRNRQFQNYVRGGRLYKIDCLETIRKNSTKRVKMTTRHTTKLHPDHVRCNIAHTSNQCIKASNQSLELPNQLRSKHSYPFFIKSRNAIVSRSGFLALSCGALGLFASCESFKHGITPTTYLVNQTSGCRDTNAQSGKKGDSRCPFVSYDRVFVVTQYNDADIVHFFLEVIPKVLYHLDFLLDNPDIKIHFGFSKKDFLPMIQVPQMTFEWLGLGHRLITGLVHAKEVYLPREGGCDDAGYNAWEIVTARETFLRLANITQNPSSGQRSVLVIESSLSMYVSQKNDLRRLNLSKFLLRDLAEVLYLYFTSHRIEFIIDSDSDLVDCRECQIRKFQDADVVIGIHGGSLTNTMFMRPGSVVMEIFPVYDPRHMPLHGTFPRLSGIIGLHHYSYYAKPGLDSLIATTVAEAALGFAIEVGLTV
jgi:Glycosyltransferase 61